MRNLKTILPMLAFVLAIGMSFAFVDSNVDTALIGWYGPQNNRLPVNVSCESGNFECQIQFVDGDEIPIGNPQLVFPDQISTTPLASPTLEPYKIQQ